MNVKLIAHTALSDDFLEELTYVFGTDQFANERAAVALTAIRTCYSPLKPTEILPAEGKKYFGGDGAESDRLFRHIVRSKHTSTLEHVTYTFAIEGVSRSLLAQLTRHRIGFSFSVQSQRYVKFGSDDKSGGFDVCYPPSILNQDADKHTTNEESVDDLGRKKWTTPFGIYREAMDKAQEAYDRLRATGVPAEDARYVLPNAAACNLVMTVNLRALLEFYAKRKRGNGAQWEIADLAEILREEVVKVDAWTASFFEGVAADEHTERD